MTNARRGLSEVAVLWSVEEIALADVVRLAREGLFRLSDRDEVYEVPSAIPPPPQQIANGTRTGGELLVTEWVLAPMPVEHSMAVL